MKNLLLISFAAILSSWELSAQVTVKKDVLLYYPMLPAMPSTLEDAYNKCTVKNGTCKADSLVAPLQRNINADSKSMGSLTATQTQQMQQGQALANKMKADNVQGMTDDQKLQYVQNNQQLNGGNPQQIAFAQKMKDDPAEKARLQNMTPEQKMAYLQQNGVLTPNAQAQGTMANTGSNDPGKSADALTKQRQMQSDSITQKKNQLVQALNDKMDMGKINTEHAKIDQQKQTEVGALPATGGIAAKLLENKYMKKHLELALTEMQDMTKAYQDLYSFLLSAETPFGNALTAASYGYTGDANQDKNLNTLAMGQSYILNDVNGLAGDAKSIYEFGANWQARSLQK